MGAVYRITVQGWTKDDAIAEMTEGGFGFHPIWTNMIQYVHDLNVEQLRQKAGLTPPGPRIKGEVSLQGE